MYGTLASLAAFPLKVNTDEKLPTSSLPIRAVSLAPGQPTRVSKEPISYPFSVQEIGVCAAESIPVQLLKFSLLKRSILASVARPFAYLLVPIVGVLSWQLAAAAVTGFIAKENVVGTLAVCFVGLENLIDAEEFNLLEGAGAEVAGVMAISKAAALAYLMFNLYSPPCFAAIGAMNAEMKSAKWLWSGIGLQLAVGYIIAFFVYQFGTLISEGHFGEGFIPGAVAVIAIVGTVAFLCIQGGQKKIQKV